MTPQVAISPQPLRGKIIGRNVKLVGEDQTDFAVVTSDKSDATVCIQIATKVDDETKRPVEYHEAELSDVKVNGESITKWPTLNGESLNVYIVYSGPGTFGRLVVNDGESDLENAVEAQTGKQVTILAKAFNPE